MAERVIFESFIDSDVNLSATALVADAVYLYNNDELIQSSATLSGVTIGTASSAAGDRLEVLSGGSISKITNSGGGTINMYDGALASGGTTSMGGAINNSGGTANISGGTFSTNKATGYGGAIANGGSIEVGSALFDGNTANLGGVVYNSASFIATGAVFRNNSATNWGGVFYNAGRKLDLGSVSSSGNKAKNGAVIYNAGTTSLVNGEYLNNVATGQGGVIYNQAGGLFTVTGGTFSGNTAAAGGAIYTGGNKDNQIGNASFSSNNASQTGGAIHNIGTLTSSDSAFNGNTAVGNGGAIYNGGTAAVLNINGGNFSTNNAGSGGAIYNEAALNINASTVGAASFSGNIVSGNGGAIYNIASGVANIAGAVFSQNSAANGGAIYNAGTATLSNSTLSGNTASATGGAIYNAGTLELGTVCFDGNLAVSGSGAIYNQTGATITITGTLTLAGADDTIYNAGTIIIDGSKYDYTSGPVKVVDAVNNSWLTIGSNEITVTDGYYLYFDENNIDLYITNVNPTPTKVAIVALTSTTSVEVAGVSYNGDWYATVAEALAVGPDQIVISGTTQSTKIDLGVGNKLLAAKDTLFSGVSDGAVLVNAANKLILEKTTFTNNASNQGGAIYNGGISTISGSTFSGNIVSGNGGALYNAGGAIATISGSTLSTNTAHDGGAIYNSENVTIIGSTFSGNAASGNGGAIYNGGIGTISGSTFSDNTALIGGAIYNTGTITIKDSSFLTASDSIFNSGTVIFAGTVSLNGSLTGSGDNHIVADSAKLIFAGAEFSCSNFSGTANTELIFANTDSTVTVNGILNGIGKIGFTGQTVIFGTAQNFSGSAITVTADFDAILGGTPYLVSTGEIDFTSVTFTINNQNVTLNKSFVVGTSEYEYMLSNSNNELKISAVAASNIYVNSGWTAENCAGHIWGYNAFSSIADAVANAAEEAQINTTGGTFSDVGYGNGNLLNIADGRFDTIYGGGTGSVGGTKVNMTGGEVNTLIGGGNGADVNGNVLLDLSNSSFFAIYGGGNGSNVNGDIDITLNNSETSYLFGGSAGGGHNNSIVNLSGATVSAEFGGGAINGNHNGNTTINFSNNSVIGSVGEIQFLGFGGLRVAGYGTEALSYSQSGIASWTITNSTIKNQSYIFGGGYAFNAGGRDAAYQVVAMLGEAKLNLSQVVVEGYVAIHGGARAYGNAISTVSGDATTTLESLTLSLGSRMNVYGGGLSQIGGVAEVKGTSRIEISGSAWTNDGTLNIYGGVSGQGSVKKSEIIINGTNIALNNVYGGGVGSNSQVLEGSYIKLSGSQIAVSGLLTGNGASGAAVLGLKKLEFNNLVTTLTGRIGSFDQLTVNENSLVTFSKEQNLSEIGNMTFIVTQDGSANNGQITFANGVSDWGAMSFSILAENGINIISSYNLLTVSSGSLTALSGHNVTLNFGASMQSTIMLGEYVTFDKYSVGLILTNDDKTLSLDIKAAAATTSFALGSESNFSDISQMSNSLALEALAGSSSSDTLLENENKKINGLLA